MAFKTRNVGNRALTAGLEGERNGVESQISKVDIGDGRIYLRRKIESESKGLPSLLAIPSQ